MALGGGGVPLGGGGVPLGGGGVALGGGGVGRPCPGGPWGEGPRGGGGRAPGLGPRGGGGRGPGGGGRLSPGVLTTAWTDGGGAPRGGMECEDGRGGLGRGGLGRGGLGCPLAATSGLGAAGQWLWGWGCRVTNSRTAPCWDDNADPGPAPSSTSQYKLSLAVYPPLTSCTLALPTDDAPLATGNPASSSLGGAEGSGEPRSS